MEDAYRETGALEARYWEVRRCSSWLDPWEGRRIISDWQLPVRFRRGGGVSGLRRGGGGAIEAIAIGLGEKNEKRERGTVTLVLLSTWLRLFPVPILQYHAVQGYNSLFDPGYTLVRLFHWKWLTGKCFSDFRMFVSRKISGQRKIKSFFCKISYGFQIRKTFYEKKKFFFFSVKYFSVSHFLKNIFL